MDKPTMKDLMTRDMTENILKNHNAMMEILGLTPPEDMTEPEERIAWMLAAVFLGIKDKKVLDDPVITIADKIKDAEKYGDPLPDRLSDAMAQLAILKNQFYTEKCASVGSILWNMFYGGYPEAFNAIMEASKNAQKEDYIYTVTKKAKADANEQMNRETDDIEAEYGRKFDELEAKLQETVPEEYGKYKDTGSKFTNAFNGRTTARQRGPRITKAETNPETLEFETAREKLDQAIKEKFPEYYELDKKLYGEYYAALANATKHRDKAITDARVRAEAEWEKMHPEN